MSIDDSRIQSVDLNEFLEYYLLDSNEQIDKLGSGLLQLEKDAKNMELINDLFRSAHSLKGASGTMGYTPIVTLTHMAEDLLDKIRQGVTSVTNEVIDVLLSVTDRVRSMLNQLENHDEISVPVDDLVGPLQELIANTETVRAEVEPEAPSESEEVAEPLGKEDDSAQKNFNLTDDELKQVSTSAQHGHGVYQAEVTFAKGTLMKAVRIIITIQRLEKIATIIKTVPTSEEVEIVDADSFSVLFITNESAQEIKQEIEGISEITSAEITPYFVESEEEVVEDKKADASSAPQAQVDSLVESILAQNPTRLHDTELDFLNDEKFKQVFLLDDDLGDLLTPQPEAEVTKPEVEVKKPEVEVEKPRVEVETLEEVVDKAPEVTEPPSSVAPVIDTKKPKVAPPVKQVNVDATNQVNTIRVDTSRLDSLINLVGELVITRIRLVQIGSDLKEHGKKESLGLVDNLNETTMYLGRLMSDLQEGVMHLRMVPIGTVFNRFPRLVRDLSRKTTKDIDLIINGEDTELDKNVVEVIGDPIMHLIRNSVDHGIEHPEDRVKAGKPEEGIITLDAYHEGNNIVIVISDDGAGLDLSRIRQKGISTGLVSEDSDLTDKEIANLIFLPGFSTADQVTDISGRGVGMDVVKKAINNLGGMIDITTKKGEGTTFTIRLPLTLAIIQALMVGVGEEIYAVPLSSVLETLMLNPDEVKTISGSPVITLRDFTLPLIYLKDKFAVPEVERENHELYVIVVNYGDKKLGLVVDELRGQQEIVIKTLGSMLSNVLGVAGATILGDGKVTLIIDIGAIIQEIFNLV